MHLYTDFLDARLREGRGGHAALLTDTDRVSYRALDARAAAWAARLVAAGAAPGSRVLVALPDGAELASAFFGAIRVGAIAALASPYAPAGLLARLASYVAAAVVVTTSARLGECASDDRPVLTPEDVDAATGGVPPVHRGSPGDDAVWQFTSGSSGEPKAVRHSHWAFAAAAEAYGRGVLGLVPGDVTIAAPRLHFGYALGANLLFPLWAGASAVLFDERPTPAALTARIERYRATVLVSTPASLRQMTLDDDITPAQLASLRVVTSAGEALPGGVEAAWSARFGTPVLDGLGMTETCHIVVSNRLGGGGSGALGTPVPGYEVRVCDQAGADVPDGEPGELWVRGPSLALGYWERPEAEARVFRDGWCVPGDMVRRRPDGTLEFCGRADDMLKVNGQWVAPRAVEECLLMHPEVREAAVVGVRDAQGLVRPHAIVVADHLSGSLTGELQALVRERLAPHAHPRGVTYVEALPRTLTGKIDRAELATLI